MMENNNNNRTRVFIDRTLPWDSLPGDRLRKNVIFLLLLLLCLFAIYLIENTTVPKKDRKEQEVPERLAELVMKRKQEEEPPPPPEPEEEEPEEEEEEEPEEEEPEEEPEPEPEKEIDKAREKAKKELEVFDDQLAGLRDLAPQQQRDTSQLRRGGSESAEIERNLITSRAGQGSGGIQTAKASSGGGGGGSLDAGQMQEVESDIADKGQSAQETRTTKEGKSQRTRQQIRRVFDQYGGRLYSIYARALRKNPALQGTVTFVLEIAPSGEVTAVSIKSSELEAPSVEQKLLLIVKTFDFGKLPVEPWKGDYTINFFPR